MVIAKEFSLRCPRCKNEMTHFTQIMFCDDYTVVVNGLCCGVQITSGPINILELLPTRKEERRH